MAREFAVRQTLKDGTITWTIVFPKDKRRTFVCKVIPGELLLPELVEVIKIAPKSVGD